MAHSLQYIVFTFAADTVVFVFVNTHTVSPLVYGVYTLKYFAADTCHTTTTQPRNSPGMYTSLQNNNIKTHHCLFSQ